MEEPGYWVSPWAYTFVIAWNPRFIQDEFRSWRDILKPAYRGKVAMADPLRSLTYLDTYIGLRKVLDERFFQQLADLQPFFLVRSEDIMSRVVSGEYPIAFWGMPTRAYQAARKGVEVRVSYPQEGAVLLGSPWVILARAPHPNAAKLRIDFIYYIINEALSTGRDDMPVPSQLRKFTPPVTEIRSIPMDWKQMTEATRAQAREESRYGLGDGLGHGAVLHTGDLPLRERCAAPHGPRLGGERAGPRIRSTGHHLANYPPSDPARGAVRRGLGVRVHLRGHPSAKTCW